MDPWKPKPHLVEGNVLSIHVYPTETFSLSLSLAHSFLLCKVQPDYTVSLRTRLLLHSCRPEKFQLPILRILATAIRTKCWTKTDILGSHRSAGLCVGLTSSPSKTSIALKPWQLSAHGPKTGRNAIVEEGKE